MSFNIGFPNITATSPAEQIQQIHSYLFQIAEQLNWALGTLEASKDGKVSADIKFEQGQNASQEDAEDTFNSIKSLIIKSADIVQAYEKTIMSNFNGTYFADSDFGSYLIETSKSIKENSKGVEEAYTNVQTITDKVGNLEEDTRTTNAYIRRGLLGYDDNGYAVYGVEVGETNDDGAFVRYARFKSDRLSFYDANGIEVAYIGAGCLYIVGKSVFLGELQLGGYKLDTSDGLAFTWIG